MERHISTFKNNYFIRSYTELLNAPQCGIYVLLWIGVFTKWIQSFSVDNNILYLVKAIHIVSQRLTWVSHNILQAADRPHFVFHKVSDK